MSTSRPQTSKPRGVCRYFSTPRGCFAGTQCKFLHGEETLTRFDQSKICRYYAAGYCRRGSDCWFVHRDPNASSSTATTEASEAPEDDEYSCSICFEKPVTFGLLDLTASTEAGCDHIFCLQCIRTWRNPDDKQVDGPTSLHKCCPMCRVASPFVTPSSHFYRSTDPGKASTIEQYKASMARVPCRYFQASFRHSQRFCPFGKDCFYQHRNADGTDYIFDKGMEHYMKLRREGSGTRSDRRFVFTSGHSMTDLPWMDEFSTTLDAIRASFPTFLQQPMDEEEGDSDEEEHPRPLQTELIEQLWSEPFEALLEVLHHYESEGAISDTLTYPPPSPSPPRPRIMYHDLDSPPRGFDLFYPSTHEDTHHRVPQRISIEQPSRFSPIVTDRGNHTDTGTTPLLQDVELHLTPIPANGMSASQDEDLSSNVGAVTEDENARPTSVGNNPTLTQSETPSQEDTHSQDVWAFDSALEAPEPPVLTDGRGRVVWSSMSASRSRNARTRVEQKAICDTHGDSPNSLTTPHSAS